MLVDEFKMPHAALRNCLVPDRKMTTGMGALFGFIAAMLVAAQTCLASYLLSPGDQLTISVVGVPELQKTTMIDADGSISFPLVGTLEVAGLPLSQARDRIKSALALRVYTQPSTTGAPASVVIGMDDITVSMAEYRPVYVKGGVAKTGQYAYRPSMTVREAVALAGGYDILPVRLGNPYFDAADFRGEYEALWLDYAKQQARVWRLNAQLKNVAGEADEVIRTVPAEAPVPRSMLDEIVALAARQLERNNEDFQRQEAFLQKSVTELENQIDTVTAQHQQYTQGAENDKAYLKTIEKHLKTGTSTQVRLVEARRNVLLSETRALQAEAELTRLRQQRADLARQLSRLADERSISALQELEDATVRLGEIRSKLQSVGEKLQYSAAAKAQTGLRDVPQPVITVYRKTAMDNQEMQVDEAFELYPGDVVEVTLSGDGNLGAPTEPDTRPKSH